MKREEWIDLSRSIVMIMVIFGHIGSFLAGKGLDSQHMSIYFMTTSAIKIPGFFAISGYLFNDKQGHFGEFFKNKVMKILVPYLALGMINMIINILIRAYSLGGWNENVTTYALGYFKNYLLGKNLWFIPCLFVVEILFFAIKKISKSNIVVMGALSLAACILGYVWAEPKVTIPWRVDTALICVFFLYIGYFIRNLDKVKQFVLSYKGCIAFGAVYLFLIIVSHHFYGWRNLDVNQNMYYNPSLCMVMIIVGIGLLFAFAKMLGSCKSLSFVGQNTLAYFVFHMFFVKLVYQVLSQVIELNLEWNIIVCASVVCLITMICMAPLMLLINRYVPFIVGKNFRRSDEK